MNHDPYRAPAADGDAPPQSMRLPVVLLGASTLLVALLAAWCFYLSSALATLSAADAASIEQLEQIAQRIEALAAGPQRDGLAEYFERNREFLLDDIRYQRSAQLNFMIVGGLLIGVVLLQFGILFAIRCKAAPGN